VPSRPCSRHQINTWVRNGGRPGIGDERYVASRECREEIIPPPPLIVLVVTDHAGPDAKMLEQSTAMAGIFCRDERNRTQHVKRSLSDIA
jgi:hypothetical protein